MPRLAWLLVPLAVAVVVAAPSGVPDQAAQGPFAGAFVERPSPAPAGSAQPNLAVGPDGALWLSWLETREEGGHRFRVSRLAGESWTPPVTVAEGPRFFANWADFPSVFVARDGTIAVHWLQRGDGRGTYDYGVRVRTSRDGVTWTDALIPYGDRSPTEHGFVSFYDDPKSGLGLIWLDGRNMGGHEGQGSMSLRSASLQGGQPSHEQLIDGKVCDCCQTSAAATDEGVVIAYRDRSDDEIRDMSIARLIDGRWTQPTSLHADGWQINACPVNGPSVAARGRSVAAAWFTAEGGTPRSLVAFSSDGGASFGQPVQIGSADTLGRVAVVMPGPDRALVSSLERDQDGGQVVVRQVRPAGSARVSEPTVVARTAPQRASGFARMAIDGRGRLFVAWTDVRPAAPPRVRIASAGLR